MLFFLSVSSDQEVVTRTRSSLPYIIAIAVCLPVLLTVTLVLLIKNRQLKHRLRNTPASHPEVPPEHSPQLPCKEEKGAFVQQTLENLVYTQAAPEQTTTFQEEPTYVNSLPLQSGGSEAEYENLPRTING